MLNYIVERKNPVSGRWTFVPEWDDFGSRPFCRPAFEITDTHLVRKLVWPGQTLHVGFGVPAQWGDFSEGDEGRFTVFRNADCDGKHVISSHRFVADRSGQPTPSWSPRPQ